MTIAREEIFGPVLSVIEFDTEAEAVAIANDTPYGLAASLYTEDLNVAHRVARELRAGVVGVNAYSEGDMTTPFGGYKLSGLRRPRQVASTPTTSTPRPRRSGSSSARRRAAPARRRVGAAGRRTLAQRRPLQRRGFDGGPVATGGAGVPAPASRRR